MKSIKQHQKSGWEYKGEQHNGYADGNGVLTKNNIVQNGYFEKGIMTQGCITNTVNGTTIADGIFNSNGDIIEGIFHHNSLKCKYEGTFRNKKLHGPEGRLWHLDDNGNPSILEEGAFVDGDIIEGTIYNNSSKFKYQGIFRNKKLHGPNGKISSINNDNTLTIRAEGNFVDGCLTGHGKFLEEDGKLYEGNFENLKLNGQGYVTYTASGYKFKYEGIFKNNILNDNHGSIMMTDLDGSQFKYEGGFKYNVEHGQGKQIINISGDKYTYVGMFKDSDYHGFGKYSKNSRIIHLGKWKNGRPKSNPYFCSFCNIKSDVKFKTCDDCRSVVYCDKQCQSKDWKCHKELCDLLSSLSSKEKISDAL